MIITRAPLRISFFGGGTDFLQWFSREKAIVIGATIDKYSYTSIRYTQPFADYKTKLTYSKTEIVKSHDEIEHGAIREALSLTGTTRGVEIVHQSDLPSRCGLGSSSSFLVSLLHALKKLKNDVLIERKSLADDANLIERFILREAGGFQDPVHTATGGFKYIYWEGGYRPTASVPITLNPTFVGRLNDCSYLIYLGNQRTASQISSSYVLADDICISLRQIADDGLKAFCDQDIPKIGKLLSESWEAKKRLSEKITVTRVDEIVESLKKEGAYGVKMLGAGGGGFLFMLGPENFVFPDGLKDWVVPFNYESQGATVIYEG